MKWFEFREDQSIDDNRSRRLMECPALSPVQLEALRQLRMTVWDGNLISKQARTDLVSMGLAVQWNGWQIITQEGMAVLDTLGEMKDDRWPRTA